MNTGPDAAGDGALAGIRVLDLSRVLAGPLCGQMLGDHGAVVTKVEPPAGDETRDWGPPFLENSTSAYFLGLNRNKRNICVDLTSAGGQEILTALLAESDVVVENFRAGTMAKWGFDYESVLRERHPRLVYCRITGFGADGPMGGVPGYDAVLQAYGGLMSVNGEEDGDPLRVGVPIVDLVAANLAFSGILLALLDRERSGPGQLVDITLLDAVVSILHPHSSTWLVSGAVPRRSGRFHPMVVPYQTFAAQDRPLFLAATNDRTFRKLCDVLGRLDLVDDPRFVSNADRVRNRHELERELADAIGRHQAEPLAAALLRRGVAAGPVNSVPQALMSPQVAHRGLLTYHDGEPTVGIPIKLGRTPGSLRTRPLARGANTREVLRELGYQDAAVERLIADGAGVAAP